MLLEWFAAILGDPRRSSAILPAISSDPPALAASAYLSLSMPFRQCTLDPCVCSKRSHSAVTAIANANRALRALRSHRALCATPYVSQSVFQSVCTLGKPKLVALQKAGYTVCVLVHCGYTPLALGCVAVLVRLFLAH